jgi:hypothetical protein
MPNPKQIFPLPFVDGPRQQFSKSRRNKARANRSGHHNDVTNRAIAALNGLARGGVDYVNDSSNFVDSSSCVNVEQTLQASQILQRQARVIGEVSSAARAWVSRPSRRGDKDVGDNSNRHRDIGPSSSSVDQLDSPSVVDEVHADASLGVSFFDYTQANPAVDVIADKISLPSDIGSVDLLDILPPDVAARYSRPNYGVLQLPPLGGFKQQPRAFLCTNAEYVKLVRRMLAVDMIELSTSAVCVNGLFAVAKPDGSLRLIIDERNGNQRWHAAPKVTLTTPDMIASLSAEPNVEIESAGSDIADFYHRCRIPAWMRPYHALPALKAGDISSEVAARFGHQTMVFPLCKTLPMGFSHAVFLAQSAHEFIIDSCTEMKRADRILPCNDLLLDRPRHSVYIDDFWLAGPKGCGVPRLFKQYLSVMEGKRLPAKLPKVTSPTTGPIKVLGMEFNGTTLQFGLELDKLHRLVESTQALLEAGECSGCQLSQLLGKWTWATMPRRPLLSVFQNVYQFARRAGSRRFQIWGSVARELQTICALAPLMFSNLGADWFPFIVATDASNLGQGIEVAHAATETSSSLASIAGNSAVVSREERVRSIESTGCSLDQSGWIRIVSSPWKWNDERYEPWEHINALELTAVSTAVRWLISKPHSLRSRVILLSDSAVVVSAVSKGRSSSPSLLLKLRSLTAHLLGHGIRLFAVWVPTEANPADAASRLV